MQIWDTTGQEKFQSLGNAFYRGADCCALAFDITNHKSFESLDRWKAGFLEHAAVNDPSTFPFIVLGNKLDKEADRKVPVQKAEAWAKENGSIPFYQTSALENVAVEDAFITMAQAAIKRETENQIFMPATIGGAPGSGLKLGKDNKKKSKTQV